MVCPSCGGDLKDGAKFCTSCGARLESSSEPTPTLSFNSSPSSAPPPATAAPTAYGGSAPMPTAAPPQLKSVYNSADASFSPTECISLGWQLVQPHLGIYIAITLIFMVISAVSGSIPVLPILIQGPMVAGFLVAIFKTMDGQTPAIGDLFVGFKRFLPLVLLMLVSGILTAIGCILLVIPGIYLAIAYSFAIHLVTEANMDFWAAMEHSRKVVGQRWFSIFGFGILLFLLNLGGMLLLGVGVLVTIPISCAASAIAYSKLFGRGRQLPE